MKFNPLFAAIVAAAVIGLALTFGITSPMAQDTGFQHIPDPVLAAEGLKMLYRPTEPRCAVIVAVEGMGSPKPSLDCF